MQTFSEHIWPTPQAEHVTPFEPHDAAVLPAWQMPSAVQQPVAQFCALQVVGVPQAGTKASASPMKADRLKSFRWFMAVLPGEEVSAV
jgi:hypothetical protein